MICVNKRYVFLLIVFVFLRKLESRKMRKAKVHHRLPTYAEYPTNQYLPSNLQVTAFLHQGENKTYLYMSSVNNPHLSITIITCASPVFWSISHSHDNLTKQEISKTRRAHDVDTLSVRSLQGIYFLTLMSENDTYAHVYISTAVEFLSEVLQNAKIQDVRLLKRRRRKRLTVRWETSILNPQATNYCLVVNTQKHYRTFCSALGDVYNTSLSKITKSESDSQILRYFELKATKQAEASSPKVFCVGSKTHHTLSNLRQNQDYYLDVFATESGANLTYLLASGFVKFDRQIKPTPLKDGKASFANLRKLDGKAVFAYKVGRNVTNPLEFYVVPCGGAVDVEIILKYDVIKFKKITKGLGRMVVKEPLIGGRYYLSILSINPYELVGMSGVTVFATAKPSKNPFPKLPTETVVHEYLALRKCNSVTIGWHASPSNEVRYCLTVKKITFSDLVEYKLSNYCENNFRLKSSMDISYCKNVKESSGAIITEQIDNLISGGNYVVYVTIRKRRGMALSYDALQVHTKECSHTISDSTMHRKSQKKNLFS